jgi:hypothetical protein
LHNSIIPGLQVNSADRFCQAHFALLSYLLGIRSIFSLSIKNIVDITLATKRMTGILRLQSLAEANIVPVAGMLVFILLDNDVQEWLAEENDDFVFKYGNDKYRLGIVEDLGRLKANLDSAPVKILAIQAGEDYIPIEPDEAKGLLPKPPINQTVLYSTTSDERQRYATIASVICQS